MNFKLIKNALHQKDLKGPTLEVLNQDANLYSILLFQLTDAIEYTDRFIRIANRELAEEKFNQFFKIAIEENVELAVTPEYSCPWSVIKGLKNGNRLPQESNVWIVGCESIQAQELLTIVNTQNELVWIFDEELVLQNMGNNRFFDPVCYLFKTRSQESNDVRTVVLVQFKTHFMGSTEWERNNYIAGQDIYVLENHNDSSRLITFICSDTLHQDLNILDGPPQFTIYPYLIVHIQLNPSPFNIDFTRYRVDIFSRNMSNKEILCLNWGRFLQMNDIDNWNDYGGSAIFTKSDKLNLKDCRINSNQAKGLYYTRWDKRRSNIYLLNFDEHIFNIRNTKPSQAGEYGVNPGRTGPEVINIRTWNNDNNVWQDIESTEDDFYELCKSIEENNFHLLASNSLTPINIERLIALSIGKATTENWHQVQKNEFFQIGDDGINKRMTFTHDPCPETCERRRNYLIQFARLANHIINNGAYIPDIIADLRGNCEVNYHPNRDNNSYNINLFPIDGKSSCATGIYKGDTDRATALETYEKTTKLFKDNQNWTRIVVWYHDAKGYDSVSGNKPKIVDNPSKPINSIRTIRR